MPPQGRPAKSLESRRIEKAVKDLSFLQSSLQIHIYEKCFGCNVVERLKRESLAVYLRQVLDEVFSSLFDNKNGALDFYYTISQEQAEWRREGNQPNFDPFEFEEVPFSNKYYIAKFKSMTGLVQIPIDIILVIFFFTISLEIERDHLCNLIRLVFETINQNYLRLQNTADNSLETYLKPSYFPSNAAEMKEAANHLTPIEMAYIHLYKVMVADLNGIDKLQVLI